MKAWILVGMMGSGKSSVGRALAAESNRTFVDTDQLLQKTVARPIKQFFAIYGEQAFRDLENRVLRELEPAEIVLATGGGIVLREENWAELARIGTTIYLKASPETLCKRLEITRNRRPLLQSDDWQEKLATLLQEREAVYKKADIILNVDGLTIPDVVQEILQRLGS